MNYIWMRDFWVSRASADRWSTKAIPKLDASLAPSTRTGLLMMETDSFPLSLFTGKRALKYESRGSSSACLLLREWIKECGKGDMGPNIQRQEWCSSIRGASETAGFDVELRAEPTTPNRYTIESTSRRCN